MLLVGDAASFIDPLSSYGVKKALASAWLAAVVVHTSLTNSALAAVALDLFNQREREIHTAAVRQSAHFFADAATRHHYPFWTGRATMDHMDGTEDAGDTAPEIASTRCDTTRRSWPPSTRSDAAAGSGCVAATICGSRHGRP